MNVPTNFAELIVWVGTPAAIMMVLSLLVENVPQFHKLARGWKAFIFLAVPVFMAVLSYVLGTEGIVAFLSQYDPLLQGIVVAVTGVIASKLWHEHVNKKSPPVDEGKIIDAPGPSKTFG